LRSFLTNIDFAIGLLVREEYVKSPEGQQALESYTINAAYQFGMEKDSGSLEAGKLADFVVLDQNPLKVDPDEIRKINVLATVRGGLITYSDVPEYDRINPPGGKKH
jgi:predicted amidohydrolase YtcJ